MFENSHFGRTMSILERGLNASSINHKVLSDNIANADTPGFKRAEVRFIDKLQYAMHHNANPGMRATRTDPRHFSFWEPIDLSTVKPEKKVIMDTIIRNDRNNVDIDQEMAALAKNTLYYNAIVTQITSQGKMLKDVIQRGATK